MLSPSMLHFFEKAINQSCFFGGLPFHWNSKKNRISLPLDRRDVLRWSIAAIYEYVLQFLLFFEQFLREVKRLMSWLGLESLAYVDFIVFSVPFMSTIFFEWSEPLGWSICSWGYSNNWKVFNYK